ncbi:MAG: HypC/HybG/HupF family hydrogenase formation chaperone [Actinomycetes bacterium]
MCLGIPGRIIETWQEAGTTMARADFAGEQRRICLAYLPDVVAGDHVMVHMGFALTTVDAETADSTLALMREYGVLASVAPTEDSAS